MQEEKKGPSGLIVTLAVIIAVASATAVLRPQGPIAGSQSGQATSGGASSGARTGQSSTATRVQVDKGPVATTITATGSITARHESSLTFDASSTIAQILVEQGQRVQAGQVLATVDDSSLQLAVKQTELNLQAAQIALNKILQPVSTNDIAIAEAEVKAAQGALQSRNSTITAAGIAAAEAKVAQAQSDRDYSYKILNDVGGNHKQDDPNYQLALAQTGQAEFNLQIAKLNLQDSKRGNPTAGAQANVALAQAKLAQVKAGPKQSDIDQAQAAVVSAQTQLDQARSHLANARLLAPYAGVISKINAKVGEPAQGVAMIITDLDVLQVNIKVDEADISTVRPGQHVDLTADALTGATITGKVDRIYPIADTSASVITYPVQITLDPTTVPIRAGMTVNATVTASRVENVLRVPNNYVRLNRATGQATVNLLSRDGSSISVVPVKLGMAGADYTEIIDGLNPGDTLALTAQTQAQTVQTQTAGQ